MQTRRGSRTVCLGFESREHYDACVGDAALFRGHLESQHVKHPELFPVDMERGFSLHSSRLSVKRNVVIRRIQLNASGYT